MVPGCSGRDSIRICISSISMATLVGRAAFLTSQMMTEQRASDPGFPHQGSVPEVDTSRLAVPPVHRVIETASLGSGWSVEWI